MGYTAVVLSNSFSQLSTHSSISEKLTLSKSTFHARFILKNLNSLNLNVKEVKIEYLKMFYD